MKASKKVKITLSITILIFLGLMIPAFKELIIIKHIYDFKTGKNSKTFFGWDEKYKGLKKEAYSRFLKTKAGKIYSYEKISFLLFNDHESSIFDTVSLIVTQRMNKAEYKLRAVVKVRNYRGTYFGIFLYDALIVSQRGSDRDGKVSKVNDEFVVTDPGWFETRGIVSGYLDKCNGIDRVPLSQAGKVVSLYNLEREDLPSWYQDLGWPENGFIQIVLFNVDKEGDGIPEFKLPENKKWKIISSQEGNH